MEWKQEQPVWCPHKDCLFKIRTMDSACCGQLPEPAPHDDDFNDHRLCLNGVADSGGVLDLQINRSDAFHLKRLLSFIYPFNTEEPSNDD